MASVEVADFVIRVLDWFGSNDDVDTMQKVTIEHASWDNIDYIAEMHQLVSSAKYRNSRN